MKIRRRKIKSNMTLMMKPFRNSTKLPYVPLKLLSTRLFLKKILKQYLKITQKSKKKKR